jgi:DNA-binding NtrC family response regulator
VEAPSLAFKILKNETIQYLLCDYALPEMNGLKVLEKIKREFPSIEVIMTSSFGSMETVIEAMRHGAADYFKKPYTAADLWMSIERTQKLSENHCQLKTEKQKHSRTKDQITSDLGVEFIGNSKAIKEIKQQMEMVAQTPDTSVLIIGESGTGKELVAKGIHYMSSRKCEMFGATNMSAIPENLFESEFFGHKKGSFTGAICDKAGWFETSNNGTLFLDEIGEMNLSLQVKLLRVLEERTFTKIGTQQKQNFDLRIIAATNKPIEVLTDGTSFRLDLFHRIGTFIIQLPPLYERKSDIPILANHFLYQLNQKMDKKIQSIHKEAMDLLLDYNFPGNVRELKNRLERAVILCSGNQLLAQHFAINKSFAQNYTSTTTSFDLEEIEKQTIIKALNQVHNNKAEASRLLNLEWNALYRRIQKYGIQM